MPTPEDIAHAAAVSGLPADLVKHIAGETREELTANASEVAAELGFTPKGPRNA
ncbi:hypothetical protein ACIQ8G_25880 [Streptomyces sp. NPDC094154]|uniref:hypothetical protein n=1 Tax=Streptomyces sp. NPDC094154 TaxID=3366059 RepID=UPI00380826E5